MSFVSKFEYFADRAAVSKSASNAATDPAIAYAHRELAERYEAVCRLIAAEDEVHGPELGRVSLDDGIA